MANSTLVNLGRSAFVRTPPRLAARIVRHLLTFPAQGCTVLDPTAGEGDLLFPCWDRPQVHLYGIEISAERASAARRKLPQEATILTSAVEGVTIPPASMSLVLANPPYMFQDGKRAEYRIIADAGEALMPGGIMVAIIPARSAWDGTMINHWCKWYEQIRLWKFPDRQAADDEGAFEDFTQLCVVGVRRATAVVPESALKKRLAGARWHTPDKAGQSPWEQGIAPPELPTMPLVDPYVVPVATTLPTLVVRNADEATLLYALARSGAHLSPTWQAATAWSEEGLLGSPAMPYTGEAHVAAEVLTGILDGEIVSGPGTGAAARPYLFTAFVGQEWVSMPIESEEQAKLRERGVVHVSMRQLQDKPILGVMEMQTGTCHYYQGEEVFSFLHPWLHTLASRVIEKRTPLYQLDPAAWELRVLAHFGQDKRLPKADFPGLAPAQQHRVYAMGRSLDRKGRSAIQGEPGTGKTRLAMATAARQAYLWRYRTTEFRQHEQPSWIRELRRAWLKNPTTRALLGVEPVHAPETGRVIAYRDLRTQRLLAPEEVGPAALPVLVSTPKKVTKEYGKEIRAAWPEAEVLFIETHRDIGRWFAQCAHSSAPAVIAIFSHSTTRAFGRAWQPVVQEKVTRTVVNDLEPDQQLREALEPIRDERSQQLIGFRFTGSGEVLTKEVAVSHFYCPDCGGRIEAVPGRQNQPEQEKGEARNSVLRAAKEKDEERLCEPVTSIKWFEQKPRWCRCRSHARNGDGTAHFRTPLWSEMRIEATRRKYPALSFTAWSQAMEVLVETAQREATSITQVLPLVQQDMAMLTQLVEAVLQEPEALARFLVYAQQQEPAIARLSEILFFSEAALAEVLVAAVRCEEDDLCTLLDALEQQGEGALAQFLTTLALRDRLTLTSLLDATRHDEGRLTALIEAVQQARTSLVERVIQAVQRDTTLLRHLLEEGWHLLDWRSLCFRCVWERVHMPHSTQATARNRQKKQEMPAATLRGVRLEESVGGPITVEPSDRMAAGSDEPHREQVVGSVKRETGSPLTKQTAYALRRPPADSFSPYEYLSRFYRGGVALAVIDESHNGRGRDTDIAHAHHLAMSAAQMRMLTSGTHYGGDILGFFHYWYRFCPQFWTRLGLGWNDAEQALTKYGVIQEWTKEYESEARRGSGKTTIQVSTIPAPGLSAKLIPQLLEDLVYLTVLDVGAYMPPRIEIPELVPMHDPQLEATLAGAEQARQQAQHQVAELHKTRQRLLRGQGTRAALEEIDQQERVALQTLAQAQAQEAEVQEWAQSRHLALHYLAIVKRLEELARQRNNAARMAKGTVPRWFAALPCETPFEVWQTERSEWGDALGRQLLVQTPVLSAEHLYPMEERLIEIVRQEVAEGRRVMAYFEQNDLRSMARRLQWVLREFTPWTLPNSVEAEDRQEAILTAVAGGRQVVLVPYRRVNEGLNLQRGIDTIVWVEMAMNLFMLDQASRRAWRLGKEEEVRIYFLVYAGTAGHHKLRKLGGQSGAAAAFAGEPAKGALIEHAGADQTTLARLSASLEMEEGEESCDAAALSTVDEREVLKAAFARRGAEEREALKRGRQWFGMRDTLAERLAVLYGETIPSVWTIIPVRWGDGRSRQNSSGLFEDGREGVVAGIGGVQAGVSVVVEGTLVEQQAVSPAALGDLANAGSGMPGEREASISGEMPRAAETREATETPASQETVPVGQANGKLPVPTQQSAMLIFGCEEHIQLLHPQRRRKAPAPRPRKRKVLADVQDIPAYTAPNEPAVNGATQTLWSHDGMAPVRTERKALTKPVTPIQVYQHLLWGDEAR